MESKGASVATLQRYVVIGEPKVEAVITEDSEGRRYYDVVEPPLNTQVRRAAYQELMDLVSRDLGLAEALNSSRRVEEAFKLLLPYAQEIVRSKVRRGLFSRSYPASVKDAAIAVAYHAARDTVGYGPIEPLIRDPNIEDISCNGINRPVFVYHNVYEWLTTNVVFNDADSLRALVMKLGLRSGKEPSIAAPIVEGVLRPEGYRVSLVLDTVSRTGPQFTIRKFRERPFTIIELLRLRTLDPLVAAMLWMALDYKQGVVIYGPTGSGKTTLLNAVTMLLPSEYKIVTAEDTPEIFLPFHENWAAMVTRLSSDPRIENVTLQVQVEAALRQRPDVIIIGEIRSREAYAFFQALSTGHGGITTIHAESAEVLIRRLTSPPMNVPASLVSIAKLFVNIERVERGGKVFRKVVRVHESLGYDAATDTVKLAPLVLWDPAADAWRLLTKDIALLKTIAELSATSYDEALEDLRMRATLLSWLAEKDAGVGQLYAVARAYRRNPKAVYEQAVKEVPPFMLW